LAQSLAGGDAQAMKISTLLSTKQPKVYTIGPGGKVSTAINLLTQYVGIISERDIIQISAQREDVFDLAVADVMTREVIIGLPEDDIMSVAHTMTENRFRHLPILDGDVLIGIVSIGDILKAQRDTYRGEIDTLETQILANED
jgi:CBS domain-containing protein